MKTSRELTIYYVENKCPSKVVNTIVYSYRPAFKWAARHLKDDFLSGVILSPIGRKILAFFILLRRKF